MLRALLIAMLASCTDGPVVPAESGNGCVQLNAETDLGSDLPACLVGERDKGDEDGPDRDQGEDRQADPHRSRKADG